MIVKPVRSAARDLTAPIAPVAIHPYDATLRITAAAVRLDKSRSGPAGTIPVIFSTAREDRHGSTIRPSAWVNRMQSFINNPVMQWAHIPYIPTVGNALDLQIDGDQWVANLKFATESWKDYGGANFPKLLESLMNDDMLRAVSPGFMPHAFVKRVAADMPQFLDPENAEYTDVELLELSPCNVPSGREALQRALRSGVVSSNGLDVLVQMGIIPSVFDDAPISITGTAAPASRAMEVTMKLTPGATVRFIDNEATRANAPMVACGFETDGTVVAIDGERASVEFLNPHYSGMFAGVDAASLRVVAAAPNDWTVESYSGDARVISARASRDYHAEPPAKSVRARMASLRFGIRTAREALRDICYMDPCYVPMECCPVCGTPEAIGCDCGEQAPPDVAAIEQQTLSDLIDITSEQLATALAGWDGSQHSALRFHCSGLVYDCMWRIDRLLVMADFWYPDMTFGNPADVSTEEMRKYSAWAADPKNRSAIDGIMTRVGAEISTKNRSKIQGICDRAETVAEHATTIADQCREMLKATDAATSEDSADDARGNSGTMIRVLGSDSRGEGENEGHIRVFATDRTPAGGGAASTSRGQQLYDGDVLRPKK